MSVRIPWYIAAPIVLLIGLAAIIIPLVTTWSRPSVAVGLGGGLVVAGLWAGIRGLAATLSGSGSLSSASVKVTYTIDGLDWLVMTGAVVLGLVVGLIIQFAS